MTRQTPKFFYRTYVDPSNPETPIPTDSTRTRVLRHRGPGWVPLVVVVAVEVSLRRRGVTIVSHSNPTPLKTCFNKYRVSDPVYSSERRFSTIFGPEVLRTDISLSKPLRQSPLDCQKFYYLYWLRSFFFIVRVKIF